MTDKFPLFRLPYVALYQVLNHVRSAAILLLSLCSERSKRLVKDCQGARKEIEIIFRLGQNRVDVNYDSVILVTAVASLPTAFKTVKIGSHIVPVRMQGGFLRTYWLNEKVGLKEVIKYTSDVFNRKLYSLALHGEVTSEDGIYWLEWIKTIQGKLRGVYLSTQSKVDDLVMYILENDTITGHICLYCGLSPGFSGPSPRPFSIDRLDLQPSYWVTLNHLQAMDVKQISLSYSSLTCQDLNIFLKKWINGGCSRRIKKLYVDMRVEVEGVLMEGIKVSRRDPTLRRKYALHDSVENIVGGFDVRRKEDGAMATIMYEPQRRSGLKIVFWPDDEGNSYN